MLANNQKPAGQPAQNYLPNMNKEITFDKLPEAVTYLTEQVTAIKEMVSALHPPVPEEKSLIGIDEACVIIQKAKPTIYALVRKGIVPAYKRGKKLYFYKEELLQWVESGRKGATTAISSEEQLAMMRQEVRRKPKSIK